MLRLGGMNLTLALVMAVMGGIDVDDGPVEERPQRHEERIIKPFGRTHGEMSLGYFGQWSDERMRAHELKGSDSSVAAALTTPFLGTPFSGTVITGPAFEARLVADQIRFTCGVRFPFLNYRPNDTVQTVDEQGEHRVLVRSISMWDFRTGLGYEFPFRRVTPFVDVLGDIETMSAQLSIDGAPANYVSHAFSLGGRLGLRVQREHLFAQFAVEAMGIGPLRLGGSLQVGFAI